MNATHTNAATLREYLTNSNPSVWDQVVRNELQEAACWDWPEEKMRHLRFRAFHDSPVFSDGGFLDLPDADLYVKQYGNMPWAGLPPERLRREVRTSGKTDVSARPKFREEVELAYGLNQALANWQGRAYEPLSSHERVLHGSVLVEQEAQNGDVKRMQKIFSTYDWDDQGKRYLPALRIAAARKDGDFVKALREKIGPNLDEEAFAKCKLLDATPEEKDDILMLFEAGLPLPEPYKNRAALWMGQALAQRIAKERKGSLAQPGRS